MVQAHRGRLRAALIAERGVPRCNADRQRRARRRRREPLPDATSPRPTSRSTSSTRAGGAQLDRLAAVKRHARRRRVRCAGAAPERRRRDDVNLDAAAGRLRGGLLHGGRDGRRAAGRVGRVPPAGWSDGGAPPGSSWPSPASTATTGEPNRGPALRDAGFEVIYRHPPEGGRIVELALQEDVDVSACPSCPAPTRPGPPGPRRAGRGVDDQARDRRHDPGAARQRSESSAWPASSRRRPRSALSPTGSGILSARRRRNEHATPTPARSHPTRYRRCRRDRRSRRVCDQMRVGRRARPADPQTDRGRPGHAAGARRRLPCRSRRKWQASSSG